jgi:UDP-2,4-diacetamido-2,4,6-trideoxy-beta-L-altropyranose hydrolase
MIGLGHIKRDLVLAKQFEDAKITFACEELEGNIIDQIPYETVILKSGETDELISLIKERGIDLLVIDHYGIGYEDEKRIKERTDVKIFVLDDTYERHFCDILLNHNIGADAKRYESLVPPGCELRCGLEYTLIREEFYQERQTVRVLVALGGADIKNLTVDILKILQNFPHIKADVITSLSNKEIEELKKFTKNSKKFKLHIDTKEMAKLMRKADFAIITPSVTAHEALFMDLPFMSIKMADNQKEIADYLDRNGYAVLQKFDKKLFIEVSERLYRRSIYRLIPFYKMREDEKKSVLEWRNDPSIRKWMFNKEPIARREHLSFIKRLPFLCDRAYFLVREFSKPIGVIDLTRIDQESLSAYIGLYQNPNLKGKGDVLMHLLIEQAKEEMGLELLLAEVFEDNKRALKLYERFGFREIKRENSIIKMELKI